MCFDVEPREIGFSESLVYSVGSVVIVVGNLKIITRVATRRRPALENISVSRDLVSGATRWYG